MIGNLNNPPEDLAFGDFVDYNVSDRIHNEKINQLFDELLRDMTDDDSETEVVNESDNKLSIFDLETLDSERCKIIYNQLFTYNYHAISNINNPDELEDYLNKLLHESITYNHLIQVLNIDIKTESKSAEDVVRHTNCSTMLNINNLTERVISFIKELQINSNTEEEDNEVYFNHLKSKYTSLIVSYNEHLSILTDPLIFNLSLDLIKEKIITENLMKDNEIYKNIVTNFIEQSQKRTRNNFKQLLPK